MAQAVDHGTFKASLNASLAQEHISSEHSATDLSHTKSHTYNMAIMYNRQFFSDRPHRRPLTSRNRQNLRDKPHMKNVRTDTQCFKCGKFSQWKAEFPDLSLTLTDAIRSRINHKGAQINKIMEILNWLAIHEDTFDEYVEAISKPNNDAQDVWNYVPTEYSPFDAICDALTSESPENEKENDAPNYTLNTHEILFISVNSVLGACTHQDTQTTMDVLDTSSQYRTDDNQDVLPNMTEQVCLANSHTDVKKRTFLGALIDTRAQNSVIGKWRSKEYFRHYKLPVTFRPSRAGYRFGKSIHPAQ